MSFLDNFFISIWNKSCMILSFSRIFFYFYLGLLLYFPKIKLFLGPCEPKLAVKKVPIFFQQLLFITNGPHAKRNWSLCNTNRQMVWPVGPFYMDILHVQNRILKRITKFFWWLLHPISFISLQSNWNLFLVVILNSLLGDFGMK